MSGVDSPRDQVEPASELNELMETMLEAISRLRREGYEFDVDVLSGRQVRCGGCGEAAHAGSVAVEATVRFEGDSNPDDEQILLAVLLPCGHRGLFSAAFGPSIASDAGDVLSALPVSSVPTRGSRQGNPPEGCE